MEELLLDEVVLLDAGTLITLDCEYELLEIQPGKLGVGIHVPKLVLKEYRPPPEKAEYLKVYSEVCIKELRTIENRDSRLVDLFYLEIWPEIGKSPVRETKNMGEAWALSLGIRLLELEICPKVTLITSERKSSRERFMAIAKKMRCPEGKLIVEEINYLLELLS